jgi:hypothetical protein
MGRLVHTGLGSSSLVAHVLPYPPPPPCKQLCTRSCSNKHTHTNHGQAQERRVCVLSGTSHGTLPLRWQTKLSGGARQKPRTPVARHRQPRTGCPRWRASRASEEKYLAGTVELCIHYGRTKDGMIEGREVNSLWGWVDADFAADLDTRRVARTRATL